MVGSAGAAGSVGVAGSDGGGAVTTGACWAGAEHAASIDTIRSSLMRMAASYTPSDG